MLGGLPLPRRTRFRRGGGSKDLPTLLDCLRKAILKRGLPARVYCDNGAIYGSSRQFGRVMAELDIPLRAGGPGGDERERHPGGARRVVAELDPALAFHLLDGRTLTIEGAPVYLSVRAVVIGPEMEFWVELRGAPVEGTESGG